MSLLEKSLQQKLLLLNKLINKPIVLVGLMGSGKTSIGKLLAKNLGASFVDLDEYIERQENMTISQIFTQHGESYFRQLEVTVIEKLLLKPLTNNDGESKINLILATGGGAFINESIRKIIKESSISIWIRADLEVLLERVSRKNTRPLLENGDKRQILKNLIEKRYPIYEQADMIVDTTNNDKNLILDEIINKSIEKYGK